MVLIGGLRVLILRSPQVLVSSIPDRTSSCTHRCRNREMLAHRGNPSRWQPGRGTGRKFQVRVAVEDGPARGHSTLNTYSHENDTACHVTDWPRLGTVTRTYIRSLTGRLAFFEDSSHNTAEWDRDIVRGGYDRHSWSCETSCNSSDLSCTSHQSSELIYPH